MITNREDLRSWVEEFFDTLQGGAPGAERDAAIDAATDVLRAARAKRGCLRTRLVRLARLGGETALIEHLTAAAQ